MTGSRKGDEIKRCQWIDTKTGEQCYDEGIIADFTDLQHPRHLCAEHSAMMQRPFFSEKRDEVPIPKLGGITLRDLIAIAVLNGMMSSEVEQSGIMTFLPDNNGEPETVEEARLRFKKVNATTAYEWADAMLEARKK